MGSQVTTNNKLASASKITTAERAIALVDQSRSLRERTLARRRALQEKTDKMLAHQPYVLKRNMGKQLSLNLDH